MRPVLFLCIRFAGSWSAMYFTELSLVDLHSAYRSYFKDLGSLQIWDYGMPER